MTDDDLLYSILTQLKKQMDFVLLWNGKTDKENYRSFIFLNPDEIISTYKHSEIKDCFYRIEDRLSCGYYLAGYISYEAASAFEEALPKTNTSNLPLLWFGAYKKPIIYDHRKKKWGQSLFLPRGFNCKNGTVPIFSRSNFSYRIKNIRPTKTERSYLSDISKIKDYIKRGETYQVNYTFKYKFSFHGCSYRMFFDLSRKQSVPYAALIGFDNKKILSLSPELFFRRKKNILEVKPMKGTIGRGKNILEDHRKGKQLENSAKNRAENVMIVDMLRNDLGKISKTGSVKTTRLFETEKYQTLYQMTSTIKSKLYKNSWYDIFKSIFPSGSVTGAPKIKTIQIINELEKAPRNVYTGSIGYISPEGEAAFNVAIRTILLDEDKKAGELGIGSGITISSNAKAEFNECRLKADFFIKKYVDFELIETLLWRKGQFLLLDMHLKRLKDSANYFNYRYAEDSILKSLITYAGAFKGDKCYRVRLLLNKGGEAKISSSVLKESRYPKITFSKRITDSSNTFLYHKTTNRKIYDGEYLKYKKNGFVDVIFLNEKGEVTEGAISNIIVKTGKNYYTPPVKSGLLNGVYRQYLLNSQIFPLKERVLYKQNIINAEKLFICNSVRGLVGVKN